MLLGYLLFGFTAVVGLVIILAALLLVSTARVSILRHLAAEAKYPTRLFFVSLVRDQERMLRARSALLARLAVMVEVQRGYLGGPVRRMTTSES